MVVDPWAVVVRLGRWYLLCWSHTKSATRVLRLDRVTAVDVLAEGFTPPGDLDPVQTLEQHLAEGWKYDIEVVVEAPVETVARWIPPKLGRLEPVGEDRTRLVASTDEPDWYAEQLAAIQAPFRVVTPPELVEACHALGRRFLQASEAARGKGPGR
ncbi:MAG: helix-turn-helix transcriptional regulator [Nocardioidaceae bacterium]